MSKKRIKQLEASLMDNDKYKNEYKQLSMQLDMKQRESEELRKLLSSQE